ncbi:hypothetical protein [Acidithiobacillus sulfuriphilus]|uniref:hypothetical protein n=1 Tax=Acidithiobacillus sulfuriphilus TaxID=1867749 RepID=UPI003F63ACA3
MQRFSNLAFNRDFPEASGMTGIPKGSMVRMDRDRANPHDRDAVGVWLEGCPADAPLGWLYRRDANRDAVLQKLDAGGEITGYVDLRVRRKGDKPQKVVVFWL